MLHAYELIHDADFIALLFLAGLVFYIGAAASDRYPRIWNIGAWLGATTLLMYVGTAVAHEGYEPLESVAAYILRGGLAAAIVTGCTRSVGSFCAWTWHILAPIPRYFHEQNTATRRRREAEARRQQEALEARWKEEQLQRERAESDRRAAEYRKLREEQQRRDAIEGRRRTQARADCLLCYSQHMNEIADRFSRSNVNSFIRKFMSDNQPADEVEKRGQQLQRIIKEHANAANPPRKSNSLEELANWYAKEQSQIQSLPIEDEVRDLHTVQLNIRYAELTQNLLEKIEP